MGVKYRKTTDGKIIKITKRHGVTTEEEVAQAEFERHDFANSIFGAIAYIIMFVLFLKGCVF